jgi:tRNA-2-methylthio-N6-dimethylallyladenosine synthase
MADVLAAAGGYERCEQPEDADLILFNTCSVREKAQEKVFADLGRVKHLKRTRPGLVIGVGGCVASQEGRAIVARAPYVDLVFGPQTLHRLPELLAERRRTGRAQVDVSFPEIEKFDRLPPPRVEGPSAFVSIMEGCSKYCSFCVVPYTRGEEVSRPFDDVLTEIADLADQGVKEITLLGQNVNAYRGAAGGGDAAGRAWNGRLPGRFSTWPRSRHRAHPLHHLASARVHAAAVDCHARIGQTRSARASRCIRLRPRPRAMKRLRARVQGDRPGVAGGPAGGLDLVGLHRRLPGRERARLRADARARRGRRVRRFVRVRLQPPPRHAGRGAARHHAARREARALHLQAARRHSRSPQKWSARCSACSWRSAKRDPAELRCRTENNRVVNFAGHPRLIGHFVDVEIDEARSHSLRGTVVGAGAARARAVAATLPE